MTQILHQLKAEVLLDGTGILEKVEKLKQSFTYKSDKEVYSFDDYYNLLLKQSEGIEQIQLLTTVPPGTATTYLVDLTQALQEVTDKIEMVHSRALFFAGKVRAAMHNRDSLLAAFTVWYQVALADVLADKKLKFTSSVQAALAESEFMRLLGDDVVLEGMEDAIDMLIEHLKSAKKLATEKYKIGCDQANSSIIKTPNVGLSEGQSFPLLRQRYGMTDDKPTHPAKYDDEDDDDPGLPVSEDPQYVEKREISGLPRKVIEAAVEHAEVAVVDAEDIPKAVEAWRDENLAAEYEGYTVQVQPPEDVPESTQCSQCGRVHPITHTCFANPGTETKPKPQYDDEEDAPPPPKAKVIDMDDDFIGKVKITKEPDKPATIAKEKGGKFVDFDDEPDTKPKAKPKYDDEDETPAVPASAPAPTTPKPGKKDRKIISF